jgi:hypothetical protein
VIASLADGIDVDYYRVVAPNTQTPVVLTASVRGVSPNDVVPRVEVLNANSVSVPTTILANGNGAFTAQASGLPAGTAYYVRVFAPTGATGNYVLDARFSTTPAATRQFASGMFSPTASQLGSTLYIARTQLFGLTLSAVGVGGSAEMTVRDSTGSIVYQLLAPAGETVSGPGVFLRPGQYSITYTAQPGTGGVIPTSFLLAGNTLANPVGPVAGDPTLAPQYKAPTNPQMFLYPTGTLTIEPFLWLTTFII